MKTFLVSYTEPNPGGPRQWDYGVVEDAMEDIHIWAVYTDEGLTAAEMVLQKIGGRWPTDKGARICDTPISGGPNPFNLQPDTPTKLL